MLTRWPPAVAGLLLFVVAVVLWVRECSGPQPVAGAPIVRPPEQPGQPYTVQAQVRNQGPGHGEVNVIFRLRERDSGRTYEEDRQAELDRGEEVTVVAQVPAQPGTYDAEVEVEYPPK
jgi:hypothetical protein